MRRLLGYFLRGLVFVAPLAITIYVCYSIFTTIDGWLRLPIPGAGFVLTVAIITLVGMMASNLVTRGAVGVLDALMNRLPFVRLLYSSTRDLLNAFVGEHRRFDKPVLVEMFPGSNARAADQLPLACSGRARYHEAGKHKDNASNRNRLIRCGAFIFPPAAR